MGAACDLRGPGRSTNPVRRAIRITTGRARAVRVKAEAPVTTRIQVMRGGYNTAALISFFIASAAALTALDQRSFANFDFQGSFSYANITLREALQTAPKPSRAKHTLRSAAVAPWAP